MGEVDLEAPLVEIELVEVGGPVDAAVVGHEAAPGGIGPAARFDLHDLGSEEGKQQGGVRPGRSPREVGDADPFEWEHGGRGPGPGPGRVRSGRGPGPGPGRVRSGRFTGRLGDGSGGEPAAVPQLRRGPGHRWGPGQTIGRPRQHHRLLAVPHGHLLEELAMGQLGVVHEVRGDGVCADRASDRCENTHDLPLRESLAPGGQARPLGVHLRVFIGGLIGDRLEQRRPFGRRTQRSPVLVPHADELNPAIRTTQHPSGAVPALVASQLDPVVVVPAQPGPVEGQL